MQDFQELVDADIRVDRELDFDDAEGVVAYIETWFDPEERFSLPAIENEHSIDMYVVYNPVNKHFSTLLIIKDEIDDRRIECIASLTENEKRLVIKQMEDVSRTEYGKSLAHEFRQAQREKVKRAKKPNKKVRPSYER